MRIILTGSTGFIGRNVLRRCEELGYNVVCFVRNLDSKIKSYGNHQYLNVNFDEPINFEFKKQDRLLHLAWSNLDDYDDIKHLTKTLPAHKNFLETCMANGAHNITVAGTCAENDFFLKEDFNEKEIEKVGNKYAFSKALLKKFGFEISKTYKTSFLWARIWYVYGPDQRAKSLAGSIMKAAELGEKTFSPANPDNKHDFINVKDVAARLIELCTSDVEGQFDIRSGKTMSVRNFAEKFIKEQKLDMKLSCD